MIPKTATKYPSREPDANRVLVGLGRKNAREEHLETWRRPPAGPDRPVRSPSSRKPPSKSSLMSRGRHLGVEDAAGSMMLPLPGVFVGSPNPSASSLRPIASTLGALPGKASALTIWFRRNRLQIEEIVGECLNPLRPCQMRPFGAQHPDFILFPFDLMLKLHDRLGMEDCVIFNSIGINRRTDKRGDRQNIETSNHFSGPPDGLEEASQAPSSDRRVRETSLLCARQDEAWPIARADWRRSPAGDGVTGCLPFNLKVGAGGSISWGSRRDGVRPRPERPAKNCLTMRSSSE